MINPQVVAHLKRLLDPFLNPVNERLAALEAEVVELRELCDHSDHLESEHY